MVFQDSYSSLNPRMTMQDLVAFGPFMHGSQEADARRVARDMLVKVGLNPRSVRRNAIRTNCRAARGSG